MLQSTKEHYYQVPDWAKWDWLDHGFGTRHHFHPSRGLATVKQVHGHDVLIAEHPGLAGTADGLISDIPGIQLGIKTADCLPILLIDPVHRAIGAVHAGWRGTAAGIAPHAVELMERQFDSKPEDMQAAIGPGIGKCCFEVGPDVAAQCGDWAHTGKTRLNLSAINAMQLNWLGLKTVHSTDLCTMCNAEFYSYRREGEAAGRMMSFVSRRF